MKLFTTAFLQVALISANTYFIAHKFFIGVVMAGFIISFLWSINVKRASTSSVKERLIYSSGACLGGLTGVVISSILIK